MQKPNEEHKLFVGCLPADIREEDIRMVFSTYGEVSNVHVMDSKKSTQGHCCAFVTYVRREAAEDAITVLDGKYKIRDSPDAEFIKVSWKKQGGDSKGSGKDSWNSSSWGSSNGNQNNQNNWWQSGGGASDNYSWKSQNGNDWNSSGGNSWKGGGGGGGGSWGGGGSRGGSDWGSNGGGKGKSWGDDGKGGGGSPEPSNRLFVGNIHPEIKEDALQYVFGTYGRVEKVHIMAGKSKSGQSCAFIEMGTTEEAHTAIATLSEKYEIKPGDGPIIVKFGNERKRSSPY